MFSLFWTLECFQEEYQLRSKKQTNVTFWYQRCNSRYTALSPVADPERVVYENVKRLRQYSSKCMIIGCIFGIEAAVFKKQHLQYQAWMASPWRGEG
jgi:hypothetical protein